ncbi:glycerate kinase family protein [Streptococcus sp. S784/96/1]|uniref:glycerate kinase family protein n=1 Tax=Streptococcus sp. S784/96/1 TaxID=2653499 RepID=UPI001389C053|nr:glycerate kinase [Streptococcus sp. S784/96/1]
MAKIVVASDSFKGSASSLVIGSYVTQGIHSLFPDDDVDVFAVADGGEGTIEAIMSKVLGTWETVEVRNPLGKPQQARYGLLDRGKSVVIEIAEASGLTTVPENERNIMASSTYGTGELILQALSHRPERLYIGLGGSATNDAGIGLLAAFGIRFLDTHGKELPPLPSSFLKIAELDLSHFLTLPADLEVIILSDVTNPLCGPCGASAIFGPQKGATLDEIKKLDKGLEYFAHQCEQATGKFRKDWKGAGAAGGLGFALMTFFDARMTSGIDTILDLVGFDKALQEADLVITGEGRMDNQSLQGKTPVGIANRARVYGVPAVAIVGSTAGDMASVYKEGISGVFPILDSPMSLNQAMKRTPELIYKTAQGIATFFHSVSEKTLESL